jgi:hypothetical protein
MEQEEGEPRDELARCFDLPYEGRRQLRDTELKALVDRSRITMGRRLWLFLAGVALLSVAFILGGVRHDNGLMIGSGIVRPE